MPQPSGLRLQILIALAILLLVSFVPLFFAVARVTRAVLVGTREADARAIGHALAVRAEASRSLDELSLLLRHEAEALPIESIVVFSSDGKRLAEVGDGAAELRLAGSDESVQTLGRRVEVTSRSGGTLVMFRMWGADVRSGTEALVRLFALYMFLFAGAILVFAYFALTRLIVRPVDALVLATTRVASGSRSIEVPTGGSRELSILAESISAMAKSLLSKEEAMQKKIEELTRTTEQLQVTETKLVGSEHMASVGRLAAGVAHEIGNPIAAILGMEELLLDGGLDTAEERDFLTRMKKETERVHVVLKDLLDFARAGRDEAPETNSCASVKEVVADVQALVRPQKEFRGISLSAEVAPELHARMSAGRLTQVLLNLALNAGAAIHASGRSNGRVAIQASRENDRIVVFVEDDGPGVPEPLRHVIFDPFFTTKEVGQGTGLGLSVCRGILAAHGGSIRLDDVHKAGARFVVEIPAADPDA